MAATFEHIQRKNVNFALGSEKTLWKHIGTTLTITLAFLLIAVQSSPVLEAGKEQSNDVVLQRTVRAVTPEIPMCPVSLDKLMRLKNEINSDLTKLNPSKSSGNVVSSNLSDSNSCEGLVNLIKSGVDDIKKSLLTAISDGARSNENNKLKNVIKSLVVKYEIEINNARNSLSQEYQQKVDTLLGSLKILAELANDLGGKQEEVSRDPCASEAVSGSDCCVNLNDYESFSFLTGFVERAYEDFGKQNNVESILQFAFGLPWLSHQVVVYKKLYEEMGKHKELNNPEIVMLANKVEETVNKFINSSCESSIGSVAFRKTKTTLEALKNNITFHSNKVLESWITGISSGNYENLDKLEKILELIKNRQNAEDQAVGYSSLYETMKTNNHLDTYQLLMVAYRAKKLMETDGYKSISQGSKDKLINLKNNLPQAVSSLIWSDKSCRIKNRKHGESFYAAADDLKHDADRRKVFTWVPKDAENAAWKFAWRFETIDDGKNFMIKNSDFNNEYLFASADKKNDERRWVFTWVPKVAEDEDYWKKWRLIPVDNGKYFRLFNVQFGEYLYADGDINQGKDQERRGAYTWVQDKPKGFAEEESHWEIKC